MSHKCQNCEDTGHSNPDVFDLDCTDCDVASQRYALNKFASDARRKSPDVGDLYWAIHQRALAMAPKQEELDAMREALRNANHKFFAANEKLQSLAAPAAANGALPDLPEVQMDHLNVLAQHYTADQMRAYGQACAAAGPDAALVKALEAMLEQFNFNTITGIVHDESAAIAQARAALQAVPVQDAALTDAYRALQNTLLVVPDGDFKRKMDDWLSQRLGVIDGALLPVPSGWKLVPIEPTDAMAVAAIEVTLGNPAINGVAQYRAMIAASPVAQPEVRKPIMWAALSMDGKAVCAN